MSADERKLEIALTALDEIHVASPTGTHAHDTAHAAMDRMSALPEPQPSPELADYEPDSVNIGSGERDVTEIAVADARGLAALRDLLDEIGVMAANAPEDGDSFGLLEQIAMRIAAVGVPDSTPIGEWPDPENPITGRTPGAAAAIGATAAPLILPEGGAGALRPILSATVVVAANGVIDDDRKAFMLAAFAQDGLRAVFVENATAIGELPPDPALRADLKAMAARWKEQSATHCRDANKGTRSTLEAAVLLAKARVYEANATEVRETIGEGR